jgi:hypothetical protein
MKNILKKILKEYAQNKLEVQLGDNQIKALEELLQTPISQGRHNKNNRQTYQLD